MPKTTKKRQNTKKKPNIIVGGKRNGFNTSLKNPIVVLAILFFAVVGSIMLYRSLAATYTMTVHRYNLSGATAMYTSTNSLGSIATRAGTPLTSDATCDRTWNKQLKTDFGYTKYCWDAKDYSNGWVAQGITGSGSARSDADGGNKNILLASWYSTKNPPLVANSDTGNDSASRLTVVNMQTKKYAHVELVKPCNSSNRICRLGSHAGGIAWAGQYLYVASTNGVYVFNTSDLRIISGKPVLIASEGWVLKSTTKHGDRSAKISTVSYDSSANQLVTAEYRTSSDSYTTKVMRWNLDSHQHFSGNTTSTAKAFTLKARGIQGVASYNGRYIAQASTGYIDNIASGVLFKWGDPSNPKRQRTTRHSESLYIDETSNRVWSITETGSTADISFIYSYPSDKVL